MNLRSCHVGLGFGLFLLALAADAAPQKAYGKIEVLRDTWGIPHVFSSTDEGACYGLGFATAEERGFQMTYSLRIMQGRLAELLGERPRLGRNETTLDNDRKMRTFGWERAADRTALNLDRETRALLQAYSEGVNDSFEAQVREGRLHSLFEKFNLTPEPWSPADCLLSWWHLAQFFAGDGTRELLAWRNRENPPPGRPMPPVATQAWVDDSVAVVQREDVQEKWVRQVEAFCRDHGFDQTGPGEEGPKFSHAWVVGGKRTTTRSSVLVSDPQTPVSNPAIWMEFHLSGKTFNVRGVGVPGTPGLLIGFNRNLAWGLTALGADQADLFLLETSPEHPNQYLWNGKWRNMGVRTERIKVAGAPDVELVVRDTHLGPVASAFCFRQPGEPEVALKRVPICEPDRDTIQGVFGVMRAKTRRQFVRALSDWRFPTANCVYGDARGNIGYSAVGAIPVRSRLASDFDGRYAIRGSSDDYDWQGFVPHSLLPQVVNPRRGVLLSANHRPAAAFYKIPAGLSTGSMGDTIRSWRLRERLSATGPSSPEQVLQVHYDTVNPARRDLVRLGLHVRDTNKDALTEEALAALRVLEPWLLDGASSDLRQPGAPLATQLSTFFRFIATPLALKYGGGESGLARFLKASTARIEADPKTVLDQDECDFIDLTLTTAWGNAGQASGRESRPQARQGAQDRQRLGWFNSLDGFGSLDPANDLPSAAITCLDGQTIHSQGGQSYTQYVPLHEVDSAQSICPIGHSDRADSPYRTSTMSLWGDAKLHPAPLSRTAVDKITAERSLLSKP